MFPNVPIVGFCNWKNLKDHLVRASLSILSSTLCSEPCGKRNCSITTDKTSKISKGPLNCNSKAVVYLSECKKCRNLYVGKTETKFSVRLNNYKSAHQSFKTKKQGTQKLFHRYYLQDNYEGKDNWHFTTNNQSTANTKLYLEVYVQHRLNTFFPNGLNKWVSVKNLVYT